MLSCFEYILQIGGTKKVTLQSRFLKHKYFMAYHRHCICLSVFLSAKLYRKMVSYVIKATFSLKLCECFGMDSDATVILHYYPSVSPTHISRQQASESVWASLMNEPRGPRDSREAPRAEGRERNSSQND